MIETLIVRLFGSASSIPGLARKSFRSFGIYGILHGTHAVVAIIYSAMQTIVFAHTLTLEMYAKVVAITVMGFYTQPLNQAVGRAAFVMMRRHSSSSRSAPSQVAVVFYSNLCLLSLIAVLAPFLTGFRSPVEYSALFLWALAVFSVNVWAYDIQSIFWAVGFTVSYDINSAPRRIAMIVALYYLWISHNFLFFAIINLVVAFLSTAILIRKVSEVSDVFSTNHLRRIKGRQLREQFHIILSSLMSTFSELMVLNGAYLSIATIYGVGAAMVGYDTIMKCVRVSLTGCRISAEVVLSKQTAALERGDVRKARLILIGAMVASFIVSAPLAVPFLLRGDMLFKLLLGHNDVLPNGLGPVAATLMLSAVLYQPTSLLISYSGTRAVIWRMALVTVAGLLGLSAFLAFYKPGLVEMMWSYAAFFVAIALSLVWFALFSNRSTERTDSAPC